jgi:hypothetical protein
MVIVSDARDVDPPSLNQNRLARPDTAASPKSAKANVMPVIPFNSSSQQSTINQLRQPKLRLCLPEQIDFTSSASRRRPAVYAMGAAVVSVFPFQQYLSMQVEQIPLLATPARSLARSTTAHARHDGHSGSLVAPFFGYPWVAITKVWLSIAWISDDE